MWRSRRLQVDHDGASARFVSRGLRSEHAHQTGGLKRGSGAAGERGRAGGRARPMPLQSGSRRARGPWLCGSALPLARLWATRPSLGCVALPLCSRRWAPGRAPSMVGCASHASHARRSARFLARLSRRSASGLRGGCVWHARATEVGRQVQEQSLSVWFLLTTRARRWAPPQAALTRWWPSTDPESSPSLQGATTARYPPGVRPEGRGRRE